MRIALIKGGVVANVIVASPDFLERADPRWVAQYDEIREVPDTDRACEPGARFVDGRAFERVERAERAEPVSEIDALRARIEAIEANKSR